MNGPLIPRIDRQGWCNTPKIIRACIAYWRDLKNNIFKNYLDALLGIIPLVLLPAASLLPALLVVEADFWNYTFPIICISCAGIYDAYGRVDGHTPKNIKLGVRTALNILALFLAAILVNYGKHIRLIPGILLTLCGVLLLREIVQRITTSIQMSRWFPR